MIYLIAKISVYLFCATGLGAAAGWLWRNLQAVDREVTLERQLVESRSRMPQLETTLRAREADLESVRADLKSRDEALAEQEAALAERDRLNREVERLRDALRHTEEAPAAAAPRGAQTDDEELTLHPGDPHADHVPAAAAAVPAEPDQTAVRELEAALTAARAELDRAQSALAREQRRVEELTRERELQNLSLRAIEQQLEIAREDHRRAANG